MEPLKAAVKRYAAAHANADGYAVTPVPGLRPMCLHSRRERVHTIYRPLICVVLSRAKNVVIGNEERVFTPGQSFMIKADMPVAGRIVEASATDPFLAVTVEFNIPILEEVSRLVDGFQPPSGVLSQPLFDADVDGQLIDCVTRLLRLVDHPHLIDALYPGIMRELKFCLLSGPHGAALRSLAPLDSDGRRLIRAISELRANFRQPLSVKHLADVASMGLSAFHAHFKQATSLSPGQFHKQLRLIEARRLMMDQAYAANRAGFAVGYKSPSQFTREYSRFFGQPPGASRVRRD